MNSLPEDRRKRTWADIYLGFFDGTIAEAWFKWAEWLLVTSALYALSVIGKSPILQLLAYFSALLTLLYALAQIELVGKATVPRVRSLPFWGRLIAAAVIVPAYMAMALAISSAINAVLVSTGTAP